MATIRIDPEFRALIPPLSKEERLQLEVGRLGFYGVSADAEESVRLIPTCMGSVYWLAQLCCLSDCSERYTKRPVALSRLIGSEIMRPVRAGRVRLRPESHEPVAIDYLDQDAAISRSSDTLYFIEAIGTDFVKVGICTGDPYARLSSLQTGCPFELRVLAHRPGTHREEAAVHALLESSRVRGEWFRRTPALDALCRVPTRRSL